MTQHLSDWRWFKWHLGVFCVVVAVVLWITWHSDSTSWVIIAWTVLVGVHFLVVKALNVNDDWGETRAYRLRNKTFDHKHINQIVDSAVDGDPDEDPAAPRRH